MTEEPSEIKGRILLVEDEDAIRLSLRKYLLNSGYEVHVATDGLSALKELIDYEVDVIVTDYKMKVFGGDYWIRFLKKHYDSTKIIVTSGFLKPDFNVPFPVVFKPYDYSSLEKMISDSMDEIRGS